MSANVESERFIARDNRSKAGWQELGRKVGLFILFLLCAVAVFVFGSNYYSIFPTNKNLIYETSIVMIFLILSLFLRSQPRYVKYWQVFYAFFVAAAVILVTSLTAGWRDTLFRSIGIAANTNLESGIGKVFEASVTITTILLLSRFAGMGFDSLYVRWGNLKWGLILGLGVLLNFATSALMFFASQYSSLEKLGSSILWGMVFSLFNGFLEELWLRGQFLRKLTPILGVGAAVLLTSLWFALFHLGSIYMQPAAIPFYLVNLVTFGAAWGYAMHKTDSWIAPGLMHAASDFFLFIAMLSSK